MVASPTRGSWTLFPPATETLWSDSLALEASWNVMTHAQKPDVVFRWKGRVHLNRRGASVQSTTGRRGVRIGGSNAGNTMFRGSVKGTGYPLHSPVSPSLLLPCVTVCHHISNEVCLAALKMEGWRLKGGWSSLKINSPHQSPNTKGFNNHCVVQYRSQWRLRLWVRIPPRAWMSVCCECCVL